MLVLIETDPQKTRGITEPETFYRNLTDRDIRSLESVLGFTLNEYQRHYLKTGEWLGDWTGPKRRRGKTTAVIIRHALSDGDMFYLERYTDEREHGAQYARGFFHREYHHIAMKLSRARLHTRRYYYKSQIYGGLRNWTTH